MKWEELCDTYKSDISRSNDCRGCDFQYDQLVRCVSTDGMWKGTKEKAVHSDFSLMCTDLNMFMLSFKKTALVNPQGGPIKTKATT